MIKDKFKYVVCEYVYHSDGASAAPFCGDFPDKCWECKNNESIGADLNRVSPTMLHPLVKNRPTHFEKIK